MKDCPVYLGIDPGASGGLAFVSGSLVQAVAAPDTLRDLWEWVSNRWESTAFAVIEKVGGYVAGNPSPGSAMFNFGKSYGLLLMALTAAEIPFEEVTPQRWQKGLGIPPRGKDEEKREFKNRLKERAQQLFPKEKITLSTCDALLIAEYCRRVREGRV